MVFIKSWDLWLFIITLRKKTSINKNQLQLERKVGIFDHLYMVYQWDKDGIVY